LTEKLIETKTEMNFKTEISLVENVLLMRNDLVPCCFNNWCNNHSSRFSHAVCSACGGINV